MDSVLAGYPWLPRMIDKARAARAGRLGCYYRYPCPIDAECLRRLDIDAHRFADIVVAESTDEGVIDCLSAAGASLADLATFDPVAMNARLHDHGS